MFSNKIERVIRDPEFAIKVTWIAAVSVASLTVIFVAIGQVWPHTWGDVAPMSSIIDVVLILALAYGVHRRSRICASVLLAYWVATKVLPPIAAHSIPGGEAGLIGFIFLMGTRAVFQIHRNQGYQGEGRYQPPPPAT